MSNKKIKREKFRKKRQEISEKQRLEFSKKITLNISEILKNTQIIFSGYIALFAGTQEEPEIGDLLLNHLDHKFCFPKVEINKYGEKSMNFYQVKKISDMEKGRFGIREPKSYCKKISSQEISLFCIPAIAIDFSGNRIGMGGGYYDKYLSHNNHSLKIGIIFSCQISQKNFSEFSEKFDIPMDIIISEEKIITTNTKKYYKVL